MDYPNRRRILTGIARIIAGGSLGAVLPMAISGCSRPEDAESSDQSLNTLAGVAFDLFPHAGLSPELYVRVAASLAALDNSVVEEGLARIAQATGQQLWADVPETDRIAVLVSLENSEFFALMRNTAIDVIYQDPETYALLGYGGSALEKGGYINRGFDDIDWLTEVGE